VFDFASGIRTVYNADGTVEEDSFERDAAEKLKSGKTSGGPEIKFVNKESKVDANTTLKRALPTPEPAARQD